MNQHITQEIDIDDIGKRFDVYLAELIPYVSRSRVQALIKDNNSIKVNAQPSKNSYRLKYGDFIEIKMPDAKPLELLSENIPVEIVFENDDLLVVNKPSGMLTHPTTVEKEGTLVNALLYHCRGRLSGINGIMRPGIVHRLDRDTSGLLMIAKNDFAHHSLCEQIKTKTAIRKYLTIALGNIKEDEGTIIAPIDRHPSQKCKMAVVEGGKEAITHWKVLERFGKYTFLEMTLQTGRTHQIRVHLSHIKHPVFGDIAYGGGNVKVKTNGQVLQSYKLAFTNPASNEKINIEIEWDNDIKKVLKYLRGI
ncbi:MAG: RluA family pseudouridine synthase [Candidatus Gastranaerophilaceae bacterium]|jgi:23S rRNA pseudouridine1911/1915/1917 synthase